MAINDQYQLLPDLSEEEYKSLKEDIFNRGVQVPIELDEEGNVLDGHHRLKICAELGIKDYPSIIRPGLNNKEKIHHVLSLNLNRRHLDKEQRKELHIKLREMGMSYRAIAEMTKVDASTVYDDTTGVGIPTPVTTGKDGKKYPSKKNPSVINKNNKERKKSLKLFESLSTDNLPDEMISPTELANIKHQYDKNNHREEIAKNVGDLPPTIELINGDFRELFASWPENSVDLIFTDPPYDEKSIPLYGDLAKVASRILKPGGSLLCYAGHYAIGEIIQLMSANLRYWWICALKHSGPARRLVGKNVFVEWKPILWFVKDHRRTDTDMVSDFIVSNAPEKNEHEWQQDYSEAAYYIEHLTLRNEVVIDPFAGSGTTLISAYKLGRQAIGTEIDSGYYHTARAHIQTECGLSAA